MTRARILILLLLAGLVACSPERPFDLEKVTQKRPSADGLLFDYAGLMQDITESTRLYLETIRDRYHIEIVVAAFPTLMGKSTINQAAADMFTRWGIDNCRCRGTGLAGLAERGSIVR